MKARELLHGDASFDWTIWWLAARDLCHEGRLRGRHREIVEQQGLGDYDWCDAGCDAERYAMALSSLGWCLHDAGALAAAYRMGEDCGHRAGREWRTAQRIAEPAESG
jgi:hypothetical protein